MAATKPFDGKVILITGAAQGIGESTAQYLAARGATLSLSDIQVKKLAAVVDSCEKEYPGIQIHQDEVDVRDLSAVEKWVAATKEKFGRIDGCVNNAGIVGPGPPLSEVSVDEFTRIIDVNLTGTFNCLKSEINHTNDGGSIVNIASVAGFVACQALGPYVASKHGVIGLTRQAALENANRNIRVNAVCPSFVEGEIWNEIEAYSGGHIDLSKYPFLFPRLAKPNEVAAMVAYLLGDESRFVTRGMFRLDGGLSGQ